MSFCEHNLRQRQYFERTVKRTMIPVDSPYLRRQVTEMVRFGNLSPGARVLEMGCGMGRYTRILAEHGLRVEGMDLSPVLLVRMRAYLGGSLNIRVHCCDVLDHPRELDGKFDAVVGFFVLHHLHDLVQSFQAMARLVKPGGLLVFLEPNPLNPLYYVQILVTPRMTWQGEKGIGRMHPKIMFDSMSEAGLCRLDMTRFGILPSFLTNRKLGSRAEDVLERFPGWQAGLLFQLFKGERP